MYAVIDVPFCSYCNPAHAIGAWYDNLISVYRGIPGLEGRLLEGVAINWPRHDFVLYFGEALAGVNLTSAFLAHLPVLAYL